MKTPRHILIRGVNWLGDAVMTMPAVQRLREAHPHADIALLTHEKLADLWKQHPAVSETISFGAGESVVSVARKLRGRNFDSAVVFPNSPRAALETWLAGIPQRIGYARAWRNWFLTNALLPRAGRVTMRKRSVAEINRLVAAASSSQHSYNHAASTATAHQIHEYLHLAAALGANSEPVAPRIEVLMDEAKAVAAKFSLPDGTLLFGMFPGAEYGPAKRWPAKRFIAAAQEIQRRTNCSWLIFGGKADAEITARIARESRILNPESRISTCLDLAGKTTLRELMALLKLCRVVLTNDSGPMHVAAAVGAPVVAPFGSTSPDLTGPGLPGDSLHELLRNNAPCSPCFLRECPIDFRCMNEISVERVVEATLRIIGKPS